MMRSMFSGVAGLRAHQTMMDVVGNNIANVNTAGFKASEVTFQEALTQVMRGPSTNINPLQLGLGVQVAGIDPVFTQGASQVTGRSTDLAIQGDGFFVIQQGTGQIFTRAGSFNFDASGNLTTTDGGKVMGWMADATGKVDPNGGITAISIPIGQVLPSKTTTTVEMGGNIASDAATGATVNKSISIYDSVGAAHSLVITFTKTGANAWGAAAKIDGTAVTLTPAALAFGTNGQLTSSGTLAVSGFTPTGADPMAFNLDLAGTQPLVQFGGGSTIELLSQDGMAIGTLQGIKVSSDGTVTGQFSNGLTRVMAQVATATFANPAGLVRIGDSNFSSSVASGLALVGAPGTSSRGNLSAGALEMSNVDLAQEFTNMIIAERGFQANSKVITTSDDMLNDLVSIKR
jgi:flagellar hook protein FlgE